MRQILLPFFCVLQLAVFGQTDNNQGAKILADSNNVFAFKLFVRIKNDKNLFFSPFSISSALAMTYAGARNETEKQMSYVLNFSLDQSKFHDEFKHLIGVIEGDNASGLQLDIANSLWAQKGYNFLSSYMDLVKSNYNSELQKVDFVRETEKTRLEINSWVEEKTNNKIKDLIGYGDLDAGTALVLVNAIYFHGKWAKKFSDSLTRKGAFYIGRGSVQANFMNKKDKYNYYENDQVQVVELPYMGNKVSMLIFLPKEKDGLTDLEGMFNYPFYSAIINSMRKQEVVLSMPKFKTTASFKLGEVLKEMGMPVAFGSAADFSGMDGIPDLYISKVLHKAFIDVSEEGTEAAASTAVIMEVKAYHPNREFTADHPFIFVIKDNATGSILFMGEIQNPLDSGE